MSSLRWILLAVGVLVVAYVYWRGRRDLRPGARGSAPRIEPTRGTDTAPVASAARERREPTLGDMAMAPEDVVHDQPPPWPAPAESRAFAATSKAAPAAPPVSGAPAPGAAPTQPAHTPKPAAAGARKIIALRIAKRSGERIPGGALLQALRAAGLMYGEYKAFHRYPPGATAGTATPTFTVANMVEPGELDPDRMPAEDFAGVAVFTVLPGPTSGPSALTEMLNTAQRMAAALDAELLDQSGSTMTRQTADHLRDEVIEFEHRRRSEQQVSATDR